jgi:hypothetical protein
MNKCQHQFLGYARCVFCGARDERHQPEAVKLVGNQGSVIVEVKPCAICGEEVTAEDYDNQAALALVGRQSTPAHLRHFYDEHGKPVADYKLNMEKLALAHGAGEGWINQGRG